MCSRIVSPWAVVMTRTLPSITTSATIAKIWSSPRLYASSTDQAWPGSTASSALK
jgi:hypothetical protein